MERMEQMEWFLAEHPQWHLLRCPEDAALQDGVLAHTAGDVFLAAKKGIPEERIFFPAPFGETFEQSNLRASSDMVRRLLEGCRFVAGREEDLRILENAAKDLGAEVMVKVGLRIRWNRPSGSAVEYEIDPEASAGTERASDPENLAGTERAFDPEELAGIAHAVKQYRHLTVRGCFFCADMDALHGRTLGQYFRAAYETAKRMTVTLPCAMPYLCCEGARTALLSNAQSHPESLGDCLRALEIMTMQNETAFYARLFLG